jgi:hypothetical protein
MEKALTILWAIFWTAMPFVLPAVLFVNHYRLAAVFAGMMTGVLGSRLSSIGWGCQLTCAFAAFLNLCVLIYFIGTTPTR